MLPIVHKPSASTKNFCGAVAATHDPDINDVFGTGGSHNASTDRKAPSGTSEARDTGRAPSARSTGSNGRHTRPSIAGKARFCSAWHCLVPSM